MTVLRGEVACECGYVHDLVEFPCPTVWRAVHDTEGGNYRAAYQAQERLQELVHGSPDYQSLPEYQSLLWADGEMNRILTYIFECPRCGRLIWNRGEGSPDRVYTLEKERAEPGPAADRGRAGG